MDALAAFLDGPRARDVFVLKASLARPWAILVEDEAALAVTAVVRGRALVTAGDGEPVLLGPGDVAVTRGPDHYHLADDAGSPPIARVLPDNRCVALHDGAPLHDTMAVGVRTWGNSPDGDDILLVGTYEVAGEVSGRLLAALPPALVVRASEQHATDAPGLLALMAGEMTRDQPGQTAVLDRLLDLVLVGTLRTWFARPDAPVPGWYRAEADPVVGHALRLLHHNPAAPWTVASLASAVGVSRAALARRFTDLVGEPPMGYLTRWRLELAADRLAVPGTTVSSVAEEVGYASPYALSAAFKRVRGITPRDHKRALASVG
jgi:AraC-like DNA-binding protein